MLNFLFRSSSAIWFWLAVVLMFIELETWGLYLIWFVFGAIVSLIVSIFVSSFAIQLIVFLVVSIVSLLLFRNYAIHKFRNGSGRKDNISELIEMEAIVTAPIKDGNYGDIKVQGKLWRARSENGNDYELDSKPKILRIEGNTMIVE